MVNSHDRPKTMSFLGSYTKFEHSGIIRYAADRQTDKRTDLNILLSPTDSIGVREVVAKIVLEMTGASFSATSATAPVSKTPRFYKQRFYIPCSFCIIVHCSSGLQKCRCL